MPFCPKCGTRVEENTPYCPNCGASLTEQPSKSLSSLDQTSYVSDRYFSKPFIYSLMLSTILIFSSLIAGGLIGGRVSIQEANQIRNEIMGQAESATGLFIFFNNAYITLLSFIPVIGVLWMLYVQFNTGYAIGAIAKAFRIDFILVLGVTMVSPIGLLEFSAYILAIAESILIVYSILNKNGSKSLLKHSWKTVLIVLGLLFIGGIVESIAIGRPFF